MQFTINIPSNRMQQIEEDCSVERAQSAHEPGTPEPGDDADIDDIDLSFDQHLDGQLHHKLEGSLDSGDSVEIEAGNHRGNDSNEARNEVCDPLAVAAMGMVHSRIREEESS